MKVVLGQITIGKTHYSIKETSWFPVEELPLRRLQYAEIDLVKKDAESAHLQGNLAATVSFVCDRCGDPFDATISCDFYYLFKIGEDSSLNLQEMECSVEDANTVYLNEPVIDIGEVLREQVLLAVPGRRICDESCAGLCPGCGAALTHEACRCSPHVESSPFAVLEKLKKR